MKWWIVIVLALVVFLVGVSYLIYSRQVDVFILNRRAAIAVDGVRVKGDVLETQSYALVTIREQGKERTYLLMFAGDVDMEGDIGQAVDCRQWIAPRVPVLIATQSYPPCDWASGDEYRGVYVRYDSMQLMRFKGVDGATITVDQE
jgi:hypothetical protein